MPGNHVSLTTAVTASGAPLTGPVGIGGQLAVLMGATASSVLLVRWTQAQPAYVAAVVWAYVGAVIGAAGAGEPLLAVAAEAGLAIVLAVVALALRRSRAPHPAG